MQNCENDKEFIMVKAKNTLPYLSYLDESYKLNTERYFNVSEKDKQLIESLSDKTYRVYFIVFKIENDNKIPIKLYLGNCKKSYTKEFGHSLKCLIKHITENPMIIENYMKCSEMDLDHDFESGSYVTKETSPSLVKQMDLIVNPPYTFTHKNQISYPPLIEEVGLHDLAQRNEYCIREYDICDIRSSHQEDGDQERGEFQRDYERIIHSKAFRRMVDKAQIFSAEKGDHYRTRMTHTLAVCQIAKGISKELNLNLYLTEAIALGHDLGHTPFGHVGERTLDAILNGKKSILKDYVDIKEMNYGGFKHNYHSLRVVTHLEEEYIEFNGLNLSFQTLDGIWKHTDTKTNQYSLGSFISSEKLKDYMMMNPNIPLTLEGQVVKIADEIAQISHDLEDAFAANYISLEELINYLSLRMMDNLKKHIENIQNALKNVENRHRIFSDKEELIHSRISSEIIKFFISDVVRQSRINIEKFLNGEGQKDKVLNQFRNNNYTINKQLIDFSDSGKRLSNYLHTIISKKVINSSEVTLFDSNGAAIIESLFQSYYTNPRLLHKGTLRRIMRDFRELTSNVLDFEEADPEVISKEWEMIIRPMSISRDEYNYNKEEYKEKNRILVRNIVDYIAGMTDSYAKKEYNKIVKS